MAHGNSDRSHRASGSSIASKDPHSQNSLIPHAIKIALIVAVAGVACACSKRDGGLADSTAARIDSTMAAPGATPALVTDSAMMRDSVARDSASRANALRSADSAARGKRGATR